MTRTRSRAAATLPAINAVHLSELVGRWGVSPAGLFRGTSLRRSELSRPGQRLAVPAMVELVERARRLTGEPALGIYFGLQMRISWHGYLGLAAMASQNVRQAIELAVRFMPTLTEAVALSLETDGSKAALVIREQADFGSARDAIVLALIVGIWQLGCTLTGRQLGGRVDVALPEPPYVRRFAGVTPGTLRFDRPDHRLIFDADTLMLPFVTADPAALQMTREQCERELDAVGFEGPFRDRVRGLALHGGGGARTLVEVAAQLHVSSRTLKRRLAELGTSYSDILDEERKRRAIALLRTTTLTMEEIAERLGYSDVANFGRAFRRWTERTPGSYRRRRRGRFSAPRGL
jgi:AraC-like DNA-binding protein